MAFAETPTFRVTIARPSPLQRVAIVLVLAVGFVIGLVIIVPLAILTAVLSVLLLAWMRVRAWFRGLRRSGPLDGRRNVRVIERSN